MKILLVRHAKTRDKIRFAMSGCPDAVRPLTTHGREKMRTGAKGLLRLVPSLDILATSPLTRALQTARLLSRVYKKPPLILSALAPGRDRRTILRWLKSRADGETVAFVGHEPDLSRLAGWLLTGRPVRFLELGKGAACLLEFSGGVHPGRAALLWSLKPSHLRKLAR